MQVKITALHQYKEELDLCRYRMSLCHPDSESEKQCCSSVKKGPKFRNQTSRKEVCTCKIGVSHFCWSLKRWCIVFRRLSSCENWNWKRAQWWVCVTVFYISFISDSVEHHLPSKHKQSYSKLQEANKILQAFQSIYDDLALDLATMVEEFRKFPTLLQQVRHASLLMFNA